MLEHEGRQLTQSGVILDYLAGTLGLFGAADDERAPRHPALAAYGTTTSSPATRRRCASCAPSRRTPTRLSWSSCAAAPRPRGSVLDTHLAGRRYVVGDRLTIADLSLAAISSGRRRSASTGQRIATSRLARSHPQRAALGASVPAHAGSSSGPGGIEFAMPVIETRLDTRDATFREQSRRARGAGRGPQGQGRGDRARRRRRSAGAAYRPRQAVAARARPRCCSTPVRRFSSCRSSRRTACTTTTSPPPASSPGLGRVAGRECVVDLQRRDRQGRHVLPDDGEEASARAGHRAREQSAVHLSGRFGRREPAQSDRRVSGSRPLRPHLLQPGDDVRGRHPADRGRDGVVHRGRRVRAGDVGRIDHRPRAGHDLSRRAAAGEGRDRRNRQRRGAGRRRRAHAHLRRRRSLRAERPARAGDRAAHRRQPQPGEDGRRSRSRSRASRAIPSRIFTASSTPTSRSPTTCARSSRGSSTAAISTSSRPATARRW